MNEFELKLYLHQLIDNITDINVLNAVKVLLSKREADPDWWDEISEIERHFIEQGLAEADQGKLISHEEVMKEVRAKYHLDK